MLSIALIVILAIIAFRLYFPNGISVPAVPGSAGAAIQYADTHWNWPDFQKGTPPVPGGASQPNFQCAEFVARALSAAGLIPGLNPNSPQTGPQSFASYTAPNGKTYYLWNVGSDTIAGLYNYLIESGLGTDIGDNPARAAKGDVVFYYGGGSLVPADRTHTALLVQTGTTSSDDLVDAHNAAHYHVPYALAYPLTIVHLKYSSTPTPSPTVWQNTNGAPLWVQGTPYFLNAVW